MRILCFGDSNTYATNIAIEIKKSIRQFPIMVSEQLK